MDHAQRIDRNDRTALVVDDDPFIVAALAELLDEHGFDVHTASNGFSALRRAIDLRPVVVLLDIALPERSGKDLLRDFRSESALRDMAIVIVSGYADSLSESQIAEADGIVSKPFDESELMTTVQRAVQRAASRRAEVPRVVASAHSQVAAKAVTRAVRPAGSRRARGRR